MDVNQNMQNGNWTIKKFFEEKNIKLQIENFPDNMTLNQLQDCTDEDLLDKFKISSINARSELLKTIRNIKLSDQESGGSGNECCLVKPQPHHHYRASSFVARRPIDLLLLRRLSRVGSERSRCERSGCNKPQNGWNGASLDNSQNLVKTKTLHLGHSAPNISYHSPDTSHHKKLFSLKNDRPSLPSCHTPTNINKTYKHASTKESSKVSLVLQQLHLKTRRMSVNSIFSSDWSSYPSPSSAFSSVHSSQEHLYHPTSDSIDDSSVWGDGFVEQRESNSASPQTCRRRTQSFNYKVSETDSHLTALNDFYRSCFPKAIAEMEQKLVQFLEQQKLSSFHQAIKCDGSASFVLHQLLELATDCLEKSRANQISASYFSELMRGMQQLLENARLQSSFPCDALAQMIQDILIIISRPARLLECLEFDPKIFYRQLEEDEVRRINSADVIGYIYEKLGLDKKCDKDVKIQNDSPETSSNNSSFEFTRSPDPNIIPENFQSNSGGLPLFRPPQESDFETVKLISNGAYGAVQLVRHRETRKLFAMKKLLKSDLVLRNMVDQVFAERDILTFIDNPFVVSFYCSFETKKHLCMVLEYVEGGDCGALLKNIAGPLPLDMARLYFAETVLALEYLHNFGIVHRDLKPDNLLLTSAGHIKLTDFGLSKIGLMKMTTNLYEGVNKDCNQFLDYQVFGTPEYIAPEVILRQGYGRPVDWWSLGVILYQFLVGCVPFSGDTAEEVFNEIISGEILWPEEEEFRVCDEARDIIESLLERNPLQRLGFSGAAEVKGHVFFEDVDWDGLLRQKSQFVPTLADEEDTSYFDVRLDRYNHNSNNNLGDSEDDENESESELFRSFSTCSPRYSKTEQMIFGDKNRESLADTSLSEVHCLSPMLDNDLCDVGSTRFMSLNDSTDVSPKPFPNRADNKSFSSLHEVIASLEKEQIPRRNRNLKPTGSLKRQRESKVSKSSSSASLSNGSFNASRSKIPHRLVRQFSKESSGSSFDDSYTDSSPKTVKVTKGRNGFGFNFRALKVLNEVTNKCFLQHVIVDVVKDSPAHEAGLCVGDMLTHINGVRVFGLQHCQVLKLILDRQSSPKLTKSSRRKKLAELSKSQISNMCTNVTALSMNKEAGEVVEEDKGHLTGGGKNETVAAEKQNSEVKSSAATNGKLRCSGRGKFLKLFMTNALKKNKRCEERRSMWYTGNEGIANEPSDENEVGDGCNEKSLNQIPPMMCDKVICTSEQHRGLDEDDTPVEHTVEFRVLPTIKIKKSLKLGRKVLCKKKSLDVLLLPKSVLNNKGYLKKNKFMFDGSGTPMSPIFGKSAECALTSSDSTQSPTGSRQQIFRSTSGRPSSLSWAGRRMSNAMLSPLVLCSSPFKQSEKVTKSSRSPSCLLESSILAKPDLTADVAESAADLPSIEVNSPSCQ